MDIVLVPGLWLDGSSWDEVATRIERAGHRPHPVTLPGMESKEADRSAATLADHVAAVVTVIDNCSGSVLLVGHSAGAGIAYAALDARPDKVVRLIVVGGFPTPEGQPIAGGYDVEDGSIPFPDWSEFDEAELTGLDDQLREAFRHRAMPSAGCLATEPQKLSDPRRLDVPVTVVCPEFTASDLIEWIAGGEELVEFGMIKEVEYIDLPTGHWPQFSRPDDLADIILGSVPVTANQFVQAPGTEDWRLGMGAGAYFPTRSFREGLALAERIADLADVGNHRLDVDLRYEGVMVTFNHVMTWFTHRDVDLARAISAAARELGLVADPSQVQALNLMFHPPAERIRPFWKAALGWDERGEEDLADPRRRGPNVQFFGLDKIKPGEAQFHVDVMVGHDVARSRVDAVLAAGGRMVNDKFAPFWWTLADADGNLVDIGQATGREEHWGWEFDAS